MRQNLLHLLAITILSAGALLAQRPFPPGGPHGPGGAGEEQSWAQRRVQMYGSRLNLSDAQKQQALSIFTAADQSAEPLDERLGQARRALRDAARRNATPAEIDQLAAALGALSGQVAAIQAKADAAFYALLAADQKEKLDQRPNPRGMRGPQ